MHTIAALLLFGGISGGVEADHRVKVRALVGACAAVGEGRLQPDDVVTLREAGARTSAFKVLAARGLTLAEVGYPADDLLGTRAEQTRARRELD